ncbi:MAG TPA: UvrD-helicase domain-containing protein [Salinivirgaceae bacterium]|nr:UvrD-helicase domain-containing protein [Salinivirgaceae bacterium]HQA75914.1 UvrD-helicase domain-containing protein [Salinivirgaceae bacterium]
MKSNYLEELNEAQLKAVVDYNSPSLIVAGAGSGKTRVLTYRIAHLLHNNVPPYKILALTFTNKAAREMRDRISQLVEPEKARSIWMGTFHSIFARILRYEAEFIGYDKNYTIYDTTDSQNLIKAIVKERQLNPKDYRANLILSKISRAKNNLVTPQIYASDSERIEHDYKNRIGETYMIYEIYQNRCRTSNAMDFDDLLLNMNILIRDFPEILKKYQNKFSYILVDEYQDTNFSQYRIIRQLCELHRNICVVGDDSQSIYAFRGARIENILNFQTDYPDHKVFKLEQNYRSTQTIVQAANSLIAKNTMQLPKTIYSENDYGPAIIISEAITENDEAFRIADYITSDSSELEMPYSEIAVLYRNNSQSRIFEEAFRRRNIPYRIYGGITFYQRKEIKDCIAYFRMVVNPNDDQALLRIINYPARGIGKNTVERIESVALNLNVSIWQVISSDIVNQINIQSGIVSRIQKFVDFILNLQRVEQEMDAYDCAMHVVRVSGLYQELSEDKTREGWERLQNVEELFNGVRNFVAEKYNETSDLVRLSNYVENVSLLTDFDKDEKNSNVVSLMTAHASKGLEFKSVYIVGAEESLFPSSMSIGRLQDIEEERRLFYVALTRAKRKVTISWARQRSTYGSLDTRQLSRFANEIDPKYVLHTSSYSSRTEGTRLKGYSFQKSSGGGFNFDFRKNVNEQKPSLNIFTKQADKNYEGVFIEFATLPLGQKVLHQKFGKGIVESIEGDGTNRKAIINFETGTKTLLLRFARLQLLD